MNEHHGLQGFCRGALVPLVVCAVPAVARAEVDGTDSPGTWWVVLLFLALAHAVLLGSWMVRKPRRNAAPPETTARGLEQAIREFERVNLEDLRSAHAAALRHALNQPLGAISANAQAGLRVLQRTPPDLSELQDILADLHAESTRAAQLLKSAPPGGTGDVAQVKRPLAAMVHRGVELARHALQDSAVVSLEVDPAIPATVAAGTRVERVVFNLVLEAASGAPAGHTVVRASMAAPGAGVEVRVEAPGERVLDHLAPRVAVSRWLLAEMGADLEEGAGGGVPAGWTFVVR